VPSNYVNLNYYLKIILHYLIRHNITFTLGFGFGGKSLANFWPGFGFSLNQKSMWSVSNSLNECLIKIHYFTAKLIKNVMLIWSEHKCGFADI